MFMRLTVTLAATLTPACVCAASRDGSLAFGLAFGLVFMLMWIVAVYLPTRLVLRLFPEKQWDQQSSTPCPFCGGPAKIVPAEYSAGFWRNAEPSSPAKMRTRTKATYLWEQAECRACGARSPIGTASFDANLPSGDPAHGSPGGQVVAPAQPD